MWRMMSAWLSERVSSEAATVRPSRMTVTRSVMANTSSSRCETNTRARPSSRSVAMMSNKRSTSPGLSEAVGSSKISSSARSASALAISTSCRCADERRRTSASSGRAASWPRLPSSSLARRRSALRDSRPGAPSSGRKMFSSTERSGARLVSWVTSAMPAESASRGERKASAVPRQSSCPRSGRTWPLMTRAKVDLPAPLAPSSACTSPQAADRVAPWSARVLPKAFSMPDASSAAAGWTVAAWAMSGVLSSARPRTRSA